MGVNLKAEQEGRDAREARFDKWRERMERHTGNLTAAECKEIADRARIGAFEVMYATLLDCQNDLVRRETQDDSREG